MARPQKLDSAVVDAWLADHAGWAREGDASIVRAFHFGDFATALAFTVRIGMIAERRDHHPDVLVGWGKARVLWSTHDAGGITRLDLELAEATDDAAKFLTTDAVANATIDLRSAEVGSKD